MIKMTHVDIKCVYILSKCPGSIPEERNLRALSYFWEINIVNK